MKGSLVSWLIAVGATAFLIGGRPEVVKLPPVPDAHGFAGAFAGVHRTHLLAAGGANFPDGVMPWNGGRKIWHDRVFALALDTPGASWREIGRLPTANAYGVSLTVPEGVLIIGGTNPQRHFVEVWLMTLADDQVSFQPLPALPAPLGQMAGAIAGRHVHVAGGINTPEATTASASHYRLDLGALQKGWETMPALPAAGRILATAAGVDDAFYLFGGSSLAADAAGAPRRTYLRDGSKFAAGRWMRTADLPRAATAAPSPAPVAGHSVFVVSGDEGPQSGSTSPADHAGFTRQILRYDTIHDTWHDAGTLDAPAPVTVPTAPWRGGFVFFNGEIRPGVRTRHVFLFRPAR